MARTASCPSCGAPVEFKSAASILAVCGYCQSTLLRSDETLENIGRMAELVPDDSPLQLGSAGRWQDRHFAVVGRIQLRYEAGMWNEWHLLFDDGRTGWLSEAGGDTVLSFLKWVPDVLPAFGEAATGDNVWLDGDAYTITNIEQAECVAGAGELPFKVGSGYPAPLIDLRAKDKFATVDYSDGKPLLFIGAPVAFADLDWRNLRQGVPLPPTTEPAAALSCPNCGAAITLHGPQIESVACQHCGAVADLYAGKLKLWARAAGTLQAAPWLPLGSHGSLRGEMLEVIGALIRSTTVDGVVYPWREYLLLSDRREFLWLTESNGHWSLVRVLSSPPRTSTLSNLADILYEGRRYQHFEKVKAEVDYVIGEFNWKVRVGETCEVDDYICPPYVLSREWTAKELVWSHGEYVEPEEVQAAFKVASAPPQRTGVGANQPSPLRERHRQVCRRFWQLALVAVVIQLASALLFGEKLLLRQSLRFAPGDDETVLTREFKVDAGQPKLVVRNKTDLSNSWADLGLTLVDKNSGKSWVEGREVAYYSGTDSDGSWSEGSTENAIVFRDLPAGTYVLAIDPDLPPGGRAVRDEVEIVAGERVWSNFVLTMIFLAGFPLFTLWRKTAFEVRRWADSDHPKVTKSGDDD